MARHIPEHNGQILSIMAQPHYVVHIMSCHAMTMLKINGNLGQFSNSGLESFHKVTKWMLNKTNMWGGTREAHIALDLLRNYYKLLVLEIEHTENLDVISRF